MKYIENIVIGTGLSALGCTSVLIKKKKNFLILESSKKITFKKEGSKKIYFDKDGTPKKLNKSNHLDILSAKMFGGNTLIWGANCLRLFKSQFAKWPIKYQNLKKYYDKCEKILDIKHYNDDISKNFNLKDHKIPQKNFYDSNFSNLANNKSTNFIIGYARLSLDENAKVKKCSNLFDNILKKNKNKIKFNSEVEKFETYKNLTKVYLQNKEIYYCKKLFICSGVVSSSKLLVNSFDDLVLHAKESSYFIAPCFFYKRKNNQKLTDLSQLQIFNKQNKIYSELKYDPDLLKLVIKKKYGLLSNFLPNFFLNKIYILTGFLPDHFSSHELVIRKKNINDFVNFFWIEKNNLKNIKPYNVTNKYINNLSKQLNFIFLPWLTKIYNKGRSYHLASTIPMTKSKKKISTNIYGELNLNKNVYICDSSNFTTLPSCSLGLTIMANSMRIADKAIK